MENLKIGLIGLSPGNGHPYSWGAICNGYEPSEMASCPFPVIPEYLAQQRWPAAQLPGVKITHIWTQDPAVSHHVSAATKIPNVVTEMIGMIGEVDAILLARDDPENHYTMARPFLTAGIPVYIDKPLSTHVSDANELFDLAHEDWHLYSCSALRYAPELQLSAADSTALGEIRSVDAVTPKGWHNYAVHVIEPALQLMGGFKKLTDFKRMVHGDQVLVTYSFADGRTLSVRALGKTSAPLELRLYGSKGNHTLRFKDSFTAFRAALADFFRQVRSRQPVIPKQDTMAVVQLIEKGMK